MTERDNPYDNPAVPIPAEVIERHEENRTPTRLVWWRVNMATPGTPVLGYFPDADESERVLVVWLLDYEGDPDGPQWWLVGHEGGALAIPPTWFAELPALPV